MTDFYRELGNAVKSFSKQVEEAVPLSRVYQHTQERNIGALTAFRGEYSLKENRARNDQLKKLIRENGFGFIKVKGRYVENIGEENETPVDEESFLVIGGDDEKSKAALQTFLKKAGQEFDQDSILFKGFDEEDAQLHFTSGKQAGESFSVGKWSPTLLSEFHSVVNESKKAGKQRKVGFEFTDKPVNRKAREKKSFKQAQSDWWDSLSKESKKEYIKKHPNSKYKLD